MNRLAALALTLLPSLVSAEELGRITAFLDGDERHWHTITMEQGGKTVATATLNQSAHAADLQVQGHPVPSFTSKDVLSIDAQFTGQYAPGADPANVELLYTPNGLAGPLWTSRGAGTPPRLQIIQLDAWGSVGQIVAVFSGEVCRRPRLFSLTDASDCLTLNGKIETRLEVN